MSIKCLSKTLNEKLAKLAVVLDKGGSNDLYKDLAIVVRDNTMYMTAVNAKVCLVERLEVTADAGFSFAVEGIPFVKFLKKIKSKELTIEVTDSSMTISYVSGEYTCPVFDLKRFPVVYKEPRTDGISVRMEDYVSVLNRACNYTQVNTLYPSLENVMIDIDDHKINIISTDRNVIYRFWMPNDKRYGTMLIPVSNVSASLLDKHISKSSDVLNIKVDDTRTYFSTPEMRMYETHYEGQFPNWRYVDDAFSKTCTYVFDKELLAQALQSVLGIDQFDICELHLAPDKCEVLVSDTMSGRSCKGQIIPLNSEGEGIVCRVKVDRYLGAVKSLSSDKVVFEHDTRSKFNKIYGASRENEYFILSSQVI